MASYEMFEGYEIVIMTEGRLSKDGQRASGTIVVLFNLRRAIGDPFCYTGGERDWRAWEIP
jgi:hypothetical protein